MKYILVFAMLLALVACNGKKNKTEERNIIATLTESISKDKSIEGRWILPVNFYFSRNRMGNEMNDVDAMIHFSNDSVYLELWIYKKISSQVYWGRYTMDTNTIDIDDPERKDVQLKYKWAGDDLIIAAEYETLEQASQHFTRYTDPVIKLD